MSYNVSLRCHHVLILAIRISIEFHNEIIKTNFNNYAWKQRLIKLNYYVIVSSNCLKMIKDQKKVLGPSIELLKIVSIDNPKVSDLFVFDR